MDIKEIIAGFDPDFASPWEWARIYRGCGLQVVPACSPHEVPKGGAWKRPKLNTWTKYCASLVRQDEFDAWYAADGLFARHNNMGVITGTASGNLFVVDLDIHKKQEALGWWVGLLAVHNNGQDLETAEQQTGGGGLQKLFRAPLDWHCPTGKTSLGVDIRGQGGFAVLAPSLHDTEKLYSWLPGRAPWDDVGIAMAPQWLLEAVDDLIEANGGGETGAPGTRTASPGGDYDAFGHQHDGREEKMRSVVWGAVLDWHRERQTKPTAEEQRLKAAEKYLTYEDQVTSRLADPTKTKTQLLDEEEPQRGPAAFWVKWQYAMNKWDTKVAAEAAKPNPKPDDGYRDYSQSDEFAKAQTHATGQVLEYLDVRQIKAQPDPVWMIDDLINERALGFIFGPPGSLKTFLALDIALSTTARLASWWGHSINQHGAVIYLCREGVASLKFRIMAWEQHRKAVADDAPFYLIRKNLNFMNPADVGVLLATVDEIAAKAGVPIAAVFVDTVSRVLPGAKENQQEDMSLFVGACEVLQQRFDCVVVGVHHTNKTGGIRGSTVIPGAGDFLIETRREPGAMTGSIVLQKVKDGEDGKEFPFKVVKVELGGIVPRSSLMVDPSEVVLKKEGLPDHATCREILSELAAAWFRGAPWNGATNSPRSATRLIMTRWKIKRDAAQYLLDSWMTTGVIEHADRDKKNHVSGYRKLVDI